MASPSTTPQIEDDESLIVLEKSQSGLESIRKLVKGFCGGGGLFKEEVWEESQSDLKAAEGTVASEEEEVETESKEDHSREISLDSKSAPEVCVETIETNVSADASAEEEEAAAAKESEEDGKEESSEKPGSSENVAEKSGEVVSRGLIIEESSEVKQENATEDKEEATEKTSTETAEESRSSWIVILECFLLWTLFVVIAKYTSEGFENGSFQIDTWGDRIQQFVEKELVQSTSKLVDVEEIVQETVEEISRVAESEKASEVQSEEQVEEIADTVTDEQEKADTVTVDESAMEEKIKNAGETKVDETPDEEDLVIDLDSEFGADATDEKVSGSGSVDESLMDDIEHLELMVGSKKQMEENKEEVIVADIKASPTADSADTSSKTRPLAFVKVPAASDSKDEL